jgi:23S rRNA pseudouridine955/2504/2580 synthase
VQSTGKAAASDFRPVQFFGRTATLMEVEILTGRTHQIRVHAAYAGHPVAGDDKYGDRDYNAEMKELGLRRMFLHAASLSFTWPDKGTPFSVNAPLPPDLAEVINALESAAPKRRRWRR